jgi:hypothetical protein
VNQFLEWTVSTNSSNVKYAKHVTQINTTTDDQNNSSSSSSSSSSSCCSSSSCSSTINWQPFLSFQKISTTTLFDKKMEIHPTVLYRPSKNNFPAVDFIFLDQSRVVVCGAGF